jgi:hypothetical protein
MLRTDELEALWEALAEAVDRAGPERDRLMLAKLALLFAHELGDAARARTLIETALENLT